MFLKTSDVHTKIKPESHMHYEGQPMVFVKKALFRKIYKRRRVSIFRFR